MMVSAVPGGFGVMGPFPFYGDQLATSWRTRQLVIDDGCAQFASCGRARQAWQPTGA